MSWHHFHQKFKNIFGNYFQLLEPIVNTLVKNMSHDTFLLFFYDFGTLGPRVPTRLVGCMLYVICPLDHWSPCPGPWPACCRPLGPCTLGAPALALALRMACPLHAVCLIGCPRCCMSYRLCCMSYRFEAYAVL